MNASPKWLRPVAVAALSWNLLGCLAFVAGLMMGADDLARLDATQRALHESRPAWGMAGTALAVVGGTLGSLGLALLRRWALPLLVASLLGVLVQDAGFLLAGVWPGGIAVGMQAVVLAVAITLALIALCARHLSWLR